MESALRPLSEHLTCELCQQALKDRIKNLIVQWSIVKVRAPGLYIDAIDIYCRSIANNLTSGMLSYNPSPRRKDTFGHTFTLLAPPSSR